MTDDEFLVISDTIAQNAIDAAEDDPRAAIDVLCEAIAIVAATAGFSVSGADDAIQTAYDGYTGPSGRVH